MAKLAQVQLALDRQGAGRCVMPQELAARLGVSSGQTVHIAFGCSRRRVRVGAIGGNRLVIPVGLARALGLGPWKLCYSPDSKARTLHLGPLIGLMTTMKLGGHYRAVMRAAARKGMVVVTFHPTDMNLGQRKVNGWVFVNGVFQRRTMPWPSVVYNRIPNRGAEMAASTRLCKRVLGRSGVPIFNTVFFHKSRVYRMLQKDPEIQPYLLASRPFISLNQAAVFLRRYGMIYLKPNGGSKGKGIIKVSVTRGGIHVSYRRGKQNIERLCPTWAEAERMIRSGMHRRTYLIQEGLRLARYKGRPFDIRVTLYKDGQGIWRSCGPTVKIAGKGSITTHVANGGRVIPMKVGLAETFGHRAQEIQEAIEESAVTIALGLERVSGLQLGELGLDIGVNARGRIALFEANSKPGRTIFNPRWAVAEKRRSLFYLCDYAARLAGFHAVEEERENGKRKATS